MDVNQGGGHLSSFYASQSLLVSVSQAGDSAQPAVRSGFPLCLMPRMGCTREVPGGYNDLHS
jgi:hypothetical protein